MRRVPKPCENSKCWICITRLSTLRHRLSQWIAMSRRDSQLLVAKGNASQWRAGCHCPPELSLRGTKQSIALRTTTWIATALRASQ
jgi:hypothetical protein